MKSHGNQESVSLLAVCQKGDIAAQLLLENIEAGDIDPKHILLPVELIERMSCAPILPEKAEPRSR